MQDSGSYIHFGRQNPECFDSPFRGIGGCLSLLCNINVLAVEYVSSRPHLKAVFIFLEDMEIYEPQV